MVIKKVHGKKKQVRVCKPRKSTRPPRTPTATPVATATTAPEQQNPALLAQAADILVSDPSIHYETGTYNFNGQTYEAITHTKNGSEVTDAMQVTLKDGTKEIMPGLVYQTPDGYPVSIRLEYDNIAGNAGFADAEKGPQVILDSLYTAFAKQLGKSPDEVKQLLQQNNGVLDGPNAIRFPEVYTLPGGVISVFQPSKLQPSTPIRVDLSKGITAEFYSHNNVPPRYKDLLTSNVLLETGGTTSLKTGIFADQNGQIHIVEVDEANELTYKYTKGFNDYNTSANVYLVLSLMTYMNASFQDSPVGQPQFFEQFVEQIGLRHINHNIPTYLNQADFFTLGQTTTGFIAKVNEPTPAQ